MGDFLNLPFEFLARGFVLFGEGVAQLPEMTFTETDYGILRRAVNPDGRVKLSPFLMPNVLRTVVPGCSCLNETSPDLPIYW